MPRLATQAFTTAITGVATEPVTGLGEFSSLSLIAALTVAGGGTTVIVRVQTSIDEGSTWYDIARFDFTTSSAVKRANIDGRAQIAPAALAALGAEGVIHGLLGDRLRAETTSNGTYTAGSKVDLFFAKRA